MTTKSVKYIINPLTGRRIKVNGPTYKKLKLQYGGAPQTEEHQKVITHQKLQIPQKVQTGQKGQKGQKSQTGQKGQKSQTGQQTQTDEGKETVPLTPEAIREKSDKMYEQLLEKSQVYQGKPKPTKLSAAGQGEEATIPKDKHHLIPSNMPPAPAGSHSYYHHHAPFSQDFGDYVCIKKDTLRDVGVFLRDTMFTSVK